MKNKGFLKRTLAALGVAAMVVGMLPTAAFAAENDLTPTDANLKPNAQITVGKTIQKDTNGAWPQVTSFEFELTPVKTLMNNEASKADNTTMPMPAGTGLTGTLADRVYTQSVEGFTFPAAATEEKTAAFPDIIYTEPGAYMYRLKEKGSTPANIPGVDYDATEYYVVVYVVYQTKEDANGNQIPTDKVTIENITAWNAKAASSANGGNTAPEWTDLTLTDNKDQAPTAGTRPGETVGKIAISDSAAGKPNQLKYPFVNIFDTVDLTVTKTVTGDLGDVTKHFDFTVAITGAEATKKYTVNYTNAESDTNTHPIEFTTDTAGAATFTTKLKHGETFVIKDLPVNSKYTVTEGTTGTGNAQYTPSFKQTASSTQIGAEDGTKGAELATGATTITQKDTTSGEYADHKVDFTNNRVSPPLTGVIMQYLPFIGIAVVAIVGFALMLVMRKKRSNTGADRY